MKKNSLKNSWTKLEQQRLDKHQLNKIKGGTGDKADDIVVIDIISP